MGYPAPAYRTSSGREERRLSRPETSTPRIPANDNYKFPKIPANDNFKLPPVPLSLLRQAGKYAVPVGFLARMNPWIRAALTAWELFELWRDWQRSAASNGNYTLICSSPPDIPGSSSCGDYSGPKMYVSRGSVAAICGLAGQAAAGDESFVFPNSEFVQGVVQSEGHPLFCNPAKWQIIEQWKSNSSAGPDWGPVPGPGRWFPIETVPWLPDPMKRPIFKPVGDPVPPPYKYIPDREYDPDMPSDRGYEYPKPEFESRPDLDPRNIPVPPQLRARPPAKTKERKLQGKGGYLNGIIGQIARAYETLKLGRDIARAIEKSLPKEFRLKGKNAKDPGKILRNIYDHFDKVDGNKALDNIAKVVLLNKIGALTDATRARIARELGLIKSQIYLQPRF